MATRRDGIGYWGPRFNGQLRAPLLNRQWFRTMAEAKVLIEHWSRFYNEQQPHRPHRNPPSAQRRQHWLETTHIEPGPTAWLATKRLSRRAAALWIETPEVA